jgi:FAD synthase
LWWRCRTDARRGAWPTSAAARRSAATPETRLEVHVFDFSGDLYGRKIGVRLVRFLRPDARFGGLEELKAAIAADADAARAALA